MKINYADPIPIICDKNSAITISKNPIFLCKTKHTPIKYHFLKEWFANQIVRLECISTK